MRPFSALLTGLLVTCAWRLYAELAHGYQLRNRELQQPGRAQLGIELERPGMLWRGRPRRGRPRCGRPRCGRPRRGRPRCCRLGWYAAADANAWEERDWEVDLSAQALRQE